VPKNCRSSTLTEICLQLAQRRGRALPLLISYAWVPSIVPKKHEKVMQF